MKPHPPKWAQRFIKWYCHPGLLEEILGDAFELFDRQVEEKGIRQARLSFVWNAFRFFRWSNLNKSNKLKLSSFVMFRSYIKLGLRNLARNWTVSIINILGLAIAIGCTITTFIYVDSQNNMESHHANSGRIYQIVNHVKNENGTDIWGDSPILLGPDLKAKIPVIEKQTRVELHSGNVRFGQNVFRERIAFVDEDFMEMFDFPMMMGDKKALSQKNNMIISKSMMEKYFAYEDPIGKTINVKFNGETIQPFTVTGILDKQPATASFYFDFIVDIDNFFDLKKGKTYGWADYTDALFLQFQKKHHPSEIEDQMSTYVKLQNQSSSKWIIDHFEFVELRELANRDYEIGGGIAMGGHPAGKIALGATAIILILLACFNYMNIAVASSTKRLKEIALRKVMGGVKSTIVQQFLAENMILCSIAMLAGVFLSYFFFLPGFDSMIPFDIPFKFSSFKLIVIFFAGLLIMIGLISGAYPALYISRFQPVDIFRGSEKLGRKNIFSKVLLTLQLALAFMAVVFGLVFTNYSLSLNNKSWGYNPDGIIALNIHDQQQYNVYKEAAENSPLVEDYAGSFGHIGDYDHMTTINHLDKTIKTYNYQVSPDYLHLMNIPLVAGRYFEKSQQSDQSNETVINQKFADQLGWNDPLGQRFKYDSIDYQVVGVVENYFLWDFFGELDPAFFSIGSQDKFNRFVVKIPRDKVYEADEYFESIWFGMAPNDPYDRHLQKDTFDDFYRENKANIAITSIVSGITLLLACLGLYGILSYNLNRRLKEFSIRKVLGASVISIIKITNRELLWIIFPAFVIGAPVGVKMVSMLFNTIYAEPDPVGPLPIIFSLFLMIATISITVTGQILKATRINPAEILRKE